MHKILLNLISGIAMLAFTAMSKNAHGMSKSLRHAWEDSLIMNEEILGKDFFDKQLLNENDPKRVYSVQSFNFTIERNFLNFTIKGAHNPFRDCLNLWYNGEIVRSTCGQDKKEWTKCSWNVSKYRGKKVYLQIVDAEPEPGYTVAVSGIIQSNKSAAPVTGRVTEEIKKAKDFAVTLINQHIPTASKDINRPVYHFLPPSQRMNDPNGTFYENGYYHLFYQYNPISDHTGGGYMLWGHARSKDLINWEYLPVAIWPDWKKGELQCYSGSAFKNNYKRRMLFYTSVPAPGLPRSQRIVIPDDKEFIRWRPYTKEPVMSYFSHNDPDPGYNWRDPFIFEDAGNTFALLTTSNGAVRIYQALNKKLTAWEFKNIAYKTKGAPECPNFFRFGNKWMLVVSPQNPVEYVIGTFNPGTAVFSPETNGTFNGNKQYYATQGLVDNKDRQILFGLIKGFKNNQGWRDCLALPRELSIGEDGVPRQMPIPELAALRGKETTINDITITGPRQLLKQVKGDVMELAVTLEPENAQACGIRIRCSGNGERNFEIRYEKNHLFLPGSEIISVPLSPVNGQIKLRVFMDKGAIEIFSADGKLAETRVHYAEAEDLGIELFALNGKARLKSLQAWELKPAELKAGYGYKKELGMNTNK